MKYLKEPWIRYAVINIISFSIIFSAYLQHKISLFTASDKVAQVVAALAMAMIDILIIFYFWKNKEKFKFQRES